MNFGARMLAITVAEKEAPRMRVSHCTLDASANSHVPVLPARRAWRPLLPRLPCIELRVNESPDLEQLRAVEPARHRIGALVVDPVVDADAVLDGVAERGFVGARRLLSRLQRQPILRGVLVHEERGRTLVAGDEPAADERVTGAVQVGHVELIVEALREP